MYNTGGPLKLALSYSFKFPVMCMISLSQSVYHLFYKNKAARLATLGTWRMLTLGTEFSSWAQSSEPPDNQRNRRTAFTEPSSKDSQAAGEDQNTAECSKYDTVVELVRPRDLRNTDIISAHEMCQEQVAPWEERWATGKVICDVTHTEAY